MNQPIGIFDSGIGGLSIWKEMIQLLPNESFIYYADSGNCPYGKKSHQKITELSERIVQFLLERDCKLIVVACNTATGAAIDYLRAHYNISFVGLEPAVKPAAANSKTGHIGILATQGTLESRLYKSTSSQYAHGVIIHQQIGHGLVPLVENGRANSPQSEKLLRQYLQPMVDAQADQIVLGCTHYPFFIPTIKKIIGEKITIVNPAPAVAAQAERLLRKEKLLNTNEVPTYQFFTSGETAPLIDLVSQITDKSFSAKAIRL